MAVVISSQIAGALEAAHGRGVVHRDVKPQNVLLTALGEAKVADFGIARAANATTTSRLGLILGTAGYMPPEQAKAEPAGPRSDLYLRLLAKDLADRYGSAAELAEDLRRVRDGLPPAFADAQAVAADRVVLAPRVSADPAQDGVSGGPYVVYGRRSRKRPLRWWPWSRSWSCSVLLPGARGRFLRSRPRRKTWPTDPSTGSSGRSKEASGRPTRGRKSPTQGVCPKMKAGEL